LRITIEPSAKEEKEETKKGNETPKEGQAGGKDGGRDKGRERVLLIGDWAEPRKADPGDKAEGPKKGEKEKEVRGRYARLRAGEAVFVLGEKVVSALARTALDLLDRKLLALDAGKIQRVRVSGPDGKWFSLERRNGEGWRVADSPAPPFAPDADALDDTLR